MTLFDRMLGKVLMQSTTGHPLSFPREEEASILSYVEYMPALPCLGPLAPRGAVGARVDGLHRQFSPLLHVVCHCLSLSE